MPGMIVVDDRMDAMKGSVSAWPCEVFSLSFEVSMEAHTHSRLSFRDKASERRSSSAYAS